jgi:threonine synthase
MEYMSYSSTRGGKEKLRASEAILKGLAADGGLFMPERIPEFDFDLYSLKESSYQEVAYEVMKLFLDDYSKEELLYCIENAYDNKFDTKNICELKKTEDAYYLELFHGSTIAFKDMALSILPYLLTTAMKKHNINKKIVILTATSGDTGKAAMAGFADVEGTEIIVFYPKGGVSKIQELQMLTQKGENTHVVSVHGNFDAAQSGVKEIFNDTKFVDYLSSNNIQLSSANSINIGRLVPQIVYYVYSYLQLVKAGEIKEGEIINICVPTGNFGNILAAYIAKIMGLPVNKLLCASNDNKVLYDFFASGIYDKNREFILTSSPSMDILISSNLERLLYLAAAKDSAKVKALMDGLSKQGEYRIDESMKSFLSDFVGLYAGEEDQRKAIKSVYERDGYVLDTHTAVAYAAYEDYRRSTGDEHKTVIASTASPYKFSRSVVFAIEGKKSEEWESVEKLEALSKVKIPAAVEEVRNAQIRHDIECDIEDMKNTVKEILLYSGKS